MLRSRGQELLHLGPSGPHLEWRSTWLRARTRYRIRHITVRRGEPGECCPGFCGPFRRTMGHEEGVRDPDSRRPSEAG